MSIKLKRTLVFPLMLALLSLMLMSGCGKSGAEDKDTEKPTSEVTEGVTQPEKKNVTLNLCYWGSPIEKKAMTSSLEKFTKKTGIKVNGQYIPDSDYDTKITAMVAGQNSPDVAYMGGDLAFPWAEEGKLYNVYDLMKKDKTFKVDDLVTNVWYNWAPGKSFGCNTAIEAYGIYYNKDIFDKLKISYPPSKIEDALSWDKFVELAKKLTIDNKGRNALDPKFDYNNIKQYGINFSTAVNCYMNFVFQNGGDIINQEGTKFTLNSNEAADAMQKLADLINVHHVAPSPVAKKALPSPSIALQTGQIAMSIEGQWTALDLGDSKMNFGAACLPRMGKEYKTVVLGGATVIFANTKHPEESWLLWKWFAEPENSFDLHKGGLWMPLLRDWYTDREKLNSWAKDNQAHPDGYIDSFVNGVMNHSARSPQYYVKNNAKVQSLLSPALDSLWLGKKNAKEVLDGIAPTINSELKGRYADK